MSDRQYIAYYRVSTKDQQEDGHGLDAQRAAVQRYLEAHGGHLVNEYTEVESGKKNDRPELTTAIKECQRQRATLLIAKLDRLARNGSGTAVEQKISVSLLSKMVTSKTAEKRRF